MSDGNQCAGIRSALPQSSDFSGADQYFAFVPLPDSSGATKRYSITSSTVASIVGGTVRSSILAVFCRSSLLDCTTRQVRRFSAVQHASY